jgi:ATP-binding cassette subfamily B protein
MKLVTKQTYAIFWRHARRYKGRFALILFGVTAATLTETVVPLFYRDFFDMLAVPGRASAPEKTVELVRLLFFIAGLRFIEWLGWRIATFTNVHFQPRMMADIAGTCFEYLHQHSFGFFTNRFVGALVRKVNRLVDASEGIADRFVWDLFPLGLKVATILVVLAWHNAFVGAIFFGWAVVYLALNYYFALYRLRYDAERARVDSETTAQLADTITNNTAIKVFAGFRDETRWFRKLLDTQRRLRKFAWSLESYMFAAQNGLMLFVEFSVFYFAIQAWARGALSVGALVLIQVYLFQAFTRLWDFGRVLRSIYRNLADAEEMVEILHIPHEVIDKPRAKKLRMEKGGVEFSGVNFTYTKTRDVIKNFSLAIAPGEKVGLVGPSGAGKSTLVALIFRFYDIQEGAVLIDGQNIADVTQESLRQSLALVPQDPMLFHRTLIENIRYGKRTASDKEVMRAAELAHCDDFIKRLPEGYGTYVGERGIKLSGGERQRVAIARAILKNAPILVLDEATSSLDSHSEALIQDALARLMQGRTTIVIAHRLSTIMKMDRIVVMRDGKIREIGTHAELLENKEGLYKNLWELQAGGFLA